MNSKEQEYYKFITDVLENFRIGAVTIGAAFGEIESLSQSHFAPNGEWIDVCKRLPEKEGVYTVKRVYTEGTSKAEYTGGSIKGFTNYEGYAVTHWWLEDTASQFQGKQARGEKEINLDYQYDKLKSAIAKGLNDLNYQVNETDVIAIAIAVYEAFDCHKLKPLPADHSGVDLGEVEEYGNLKGDLFDVFQNNFDYYSHDQDVPNCVMSCSKFIQTVTPLISSGGVKWVSDEEIERNGIYQNGGTILKDESYWYKKGMKAMRSLIFPNGKQDK